MTANAKSDFVNVQLSAAGVAFAGQAGVVNIANGHFNYSFKVGAPVRVLTSEWRKCFSKMAPQGKPIFEISDASAPAIAQPDLAHLEAEQAAIASQIAAAESAGAQ